MDFLATQPTECAHCHVKEVRMDAVHGFAACAACGLSPDASLFVADPSISPACSDCTATEKCIVCNIEEELMKSVDCKNCNGSNCIVTDNARGYEVCKQCGVVYDQVYDEVSFDKNINIDDKNGRHVVGQVSGDTNKALNQADFSEINKERPGEHAIQKVVSRLALGVRIQDDAITLWHQILRGPVRLYRPYVLGAVSVYVAALKRDEYRTMQAIAHALSMEGVTVRQMSTSLKKVTRSIGLELPTPASYVWMMAHKQVTKLGLPLSILTEQTQRDVKRYVSDRHKSMHGVQRRHLEDLAAAFVYRACRQSPDTTITTTQRDISAQVGVGPQAISKSYKAIRAFFKDL